MLRPVNPTREAKQHLREAAANYARYERNKNAQDYTWAFVGLFYTAVHLVIAFGKHHQAAKGPSILPTSHVGWLDYIDERCGGIYHPYRAMYEKSRDARYYLVPMTEDELQRWHEGEFAAIDSYLTARGFAWRAATTTDANAAAIPAAE